MFAIVHLSDIHLAKGHANPVLARTSALAAAIASVARDASCLVIALTGDIANEGKVEEYSLAKTFADNLASSLVDEHQLNARLLWLGVPGNHDCDHTLATQLRDAAISRQLTKGQPDFTTLDLALSVLRPFTDFANQYLQCENTSTPLVRRSLVDIGSRRVHFWLINAAWCSVKDEKYGGLWLPEDAMREIRPTDADLTITLVHYPIQWFDYTTRRTLQRTLDESSQLILSGHEHAPATIGRTTHDGLVCSHVESGVLQDLQLPLRGDFAVLMINEESLACTRYTFGWETGPARFTRLSAPAPVSLIKRRRAGDPDTFGTTQAFDDFLDELGMPLTHPNPDAKHLSDFFVWPDIARWSDRLGIDCDMVSSERIASERSALVMIVGPERSGKTALGKQILRSWRAGGRVPLWFSISDHARRLSAQQTEAALQAAIDEQFGVGVSDAYLQLPPPRRAIVIDDLHLVPLSLDIEVFLAWLTARFDAVVLLANEDWLSEHTASRDRLPTLFSCSIARLLPCGPRLRHQLVAKWHELLPQLRGSPTDADRHIAHAVNLIEGIVAHDLIAPYPSALLVMLQSVSAQGSSPVNHGSLGHTYQRMLFDRLEGLSGPQINMRLAYLASLAWSMFNSGGTPWTTSQMTDWHRQYAIQYDLGNDADNLPTQLDRAGLLALRAGEWHFRHKYVYFYFVAEFLAPRVHQQEVQAVLAGLVLRLHEEDATNIFCFVAFRTRHDSVLSMLTDRANNLFRSARACDLGRDCGHLDSMALELPRLVFEHEHRDRVKSEALTVMDDEERSTRRSYAPRQTKSHEEPTDVSAQEFITAFRLVTVLGQVVRNHAGQLEAERMQLLINTTYGLSMRMLGFVVDDIAKDREAMIQDIVRALKERDKSLSIAQLQSQVSSKLVFLLEMMAYGVLKHAANSVGMGELVERTLDQVRRGASNSTVDVIDAAIQLDRERAYPRGRIVTLARRYKSSPFALGVLRVMCLTNFYVFRVPEPDRQAVCEALDIQTGRAAVLSDRGKMPNRRSRSGSTAKRKKGYKRREVKKSRRRPRRKRR